MYNKKKCNPKYMYKYLQWWGELWKLLEDSRDSVMIYEPADE